MMSRIPLSLKFALLTLSSLATLHSGSASAKAKKKPAAKAPAQAATPAPVVIRADGVEAFDQIFKSYPWELANSPVVQELGRRKITVDFNREEFKSTWRMSFTAWTAKEAKEKMISTITAILKTIVASIDKTSGVANISKVQLMSPMGRRNDLRLSQDGVLNLTVFAFPQERLDRFLAQSAYLQKTAQSDFNGILVKPDHFGDITSTISQENIEQLIADFRKNVYSKISKLLNEHRSLIQEIQVAHYNDYPPPLSYNNKQKLLSINITSFSKLANPAAVSRDYLDAFAELSPELLSAVYIRAEMQYVRRGDLNSWYFEHRGVVNGLAALQLNASKILELARGENRKIQTVQFVVCPAQRPGAENYPCGKIDEYHSLKIPMGGERYPEGLFMPAIFDTAEISRQLEKILREN